MLFLYEDLGLKSSKFFLRNVNDSRMYKQGNVNKLLDLNLPLQDSFLEILKIILSAFFCIRKMDSVFPLSAPQIGRTYTRCG